MAFNYAQFAGGLSADCFNAIGSNGLGYFSMPAQSQTPISTIPSSLALFGGSNGEMRIQYNGGPIATINNQSLNTDQIYTLPNATGTITLNDATQTLTNKTINDSSNTVAAGILRTTGAGVVISTASPPVVGQVLTAASATGASWTAPGGPQIWIMTNQVSTGIQDTTALVGGSWVTRILNTLVNSPTATGLTFTSSSSSFTLAAGSYMIQASAPALNAIYHKTRIRAVIANTTTIAGTSAQAQGGTNNRSEVSGILTVASSTQYDFQHWTDPDSSKPEPGNAAGAPGVNEVYAIVQVTKL